MSDDPCVDGCGQDAATIERLRGRLAKVEAVLARWGALDAEGFAEDFAEAVQENGAWRLARDLNAALAPQNHPRSAADAPEAPGQPGRGERDSGGHTGVLAVTPAYITQQRLDGWPDIHPEDYCHRCGAPNPMWVVDQHDWDAATSAWAAETGREGICCPSCFAKMHADATGRATVWRLTDARP